MALPHRSILGLVVVVVVAAALVVPAVRAVTVLPVPEAYEGFLVTGESIVLQVVGPTGTIVPYAGITAPVGWLLCDGTPYSQTTYADLYAVVQGNFDTGGEPAGTFRVPDMRGAAPVGRDAAKPGIDTLGETATAGETAGANALAFTAVSYIIKT